jgi:hypothetical protein
MKAMRVILVPARLRLAAALLFLCVPLAAIETVIVTRAPWWRLPYRSIGIWSASVFLISLPLSAWLMRGNRWALRVLQLFFAVWLSLNVSVALRTHNPGLGFYSLLLLGLFGSITFWIQHELGRSFFDPRMRWYQGLPKPMPGLSCKVAWGDREVDCRVGRLDREGVFVFRNDGPGAPPALTALRPDVRSELTFSFRERSITCSGLPMRALDGGRGAGFQFEGLAPDLRKQLGDFIETLRGEGYVLE